jgi:hypothetical protein
VRVTRLRWVLCVGHDTLREVRADGTLIRRRSERAIVWHRDERGMPIHEPVWNTFDRSGVGGENAEAKDRYTAQRCALAAVVMAESRAGRSVIVLEDR